MIRIYTDASATEGSRPSFAAVVTRNDEFVECVAGLASDRMVTQCGRISIHEAMGVLVAIHLAEGPVIIVTDSQDVAKAFCATKDGIDHATLMLSEATDHDSKRSKIVREIMGMFAKVDTSNISVEWWPRKTFDWMRLADKAARVARLMGEDPSVSADDKYYWLDRVEALMQLNQVESV